MRITRLNNESLRTAMSFALTSCLSLFSLTSSAAGDESPAALLGFQRTGDALEFTVISTGCTTKDHFRLDILETEVSESDGDAATNEKTPEPLKITLVRTQNDRCRRMPGPRIISLAIPDHLTSGSAIIITNSFVALRQRG